MKISSQRGSLLIIVLIFVIILTIAATSVLELSSTAYRLSMRNQLQAEARAVAESEMEYLYFKFKSQVLAGSAAQGVPIAFDPVDAPPTISDNSETPTTVFTPFLQAHADAGWRVKRSLVTDRYMANERFPGTTKEGNFTYLVARVEVIPPASSPFGTTANVRIGRRLTNSSAPIFQYSIFYQGDLEFNPGGAITTTVRGDVVANGSIYMGPVSGGTMMLEGSVRYLHDHYFNLTAANTTTYSNPDAPTPTATLVAPTFSSGDPASQLETLDEPENLLGGIDVTATAVGRPTLFGPAGRSDPTVWTAAELITAENNVYRSLIVPPPAASTYGTADSEYPNADITTGDDSVISVQRAYNKANLLITVDITTGSVVVTKINPLNGVSTVCTLDFNSTLDTPVVHNWGSVITPNWITTFTDLREGVIVKVVQLDIDNLKSKIDRARLRNPILLSPDTALGYFDFRGLVYVNLKGASAVNLAAIRLKNGATLPYNEAVSNVSGYGGFSVATNGGIYVQGDYNTNKPIRTIAPNVGTPVYPRSEDGTASYVPAMLIADCITLLSSAWVDANSGGALSTRIAAAGTTSLNAGLLTGNIPSTSLKSSGGAQNLVRYLEDWTGRNVNFYGSIGRLFTSTKFDSPYIGPGVYYGGIYSQPNRNFSFDHNILLYAPPGTPSTTSFSRGSFFTW